MTTRQVIDLCVAVGSVGCALLVAFGIRLFFRRGRALEDA